MTTHLKHSSSRPVRIVRLFLVAGILSALAAPVALPSSARASEPLRSGTILSGTGESPGSPWVRGMEGCVSAPSCSTWLQSGCVPALAGGDPALHASIVDVADFAGGATPRVLDVRNGAGLNWGTVTVQFWTMTQYWCAEVLGSRFDTWDCAGYRGECHFVMPREAEWMTITSRTDNTSISWTLS